MSKHVILFTMEGCGACKVLKEELKRVNVTYIDMDIDNHPILWEEFILNTGIGYVPSIFIVESETEIGTTLSPGKDFDGPLDAAVKLMEKLG